MMYGIDVVRSWEVSWLVGRIEERRWALGELSGYG